MYNILIIDDDPPITEGIKNIIETHFKAMYRAVPCNSSTDVLHILSNEMIHVVVSDVKMPDLNGLQLLKILKKNEMDIPVIMLSGYDNYSYIRSALLNGAYDYLLKPINIRQFLQILSSVSGILENIPVRYLTELPEFSGEVPEHLHSNASQYYFDLHAVESPVPLYDPEVAKECLDQLMHAVMAGTDINVKRALEAYFNFRPSESTTPDIIKEELCAFVYTLINRYPVLIPVVGKYKLTPYDIHTKIKNLPTCSQLKATMINIFQCYLEEIQNKDADDQYFVKIAKKFMEEHCQEEISLEKIAEQVHLSPTYFSALFKANTGTTVREYIRQMRMNKAKELLRDPMLKIYEIADRVGYSNPAHFNRSFKEMFGVSPSEYRNTL